MENTLSRRPLASKTSRTAMPRESAAKIYEVATRLFGDQSYPATSMRDISTAVGILPGSLYSHISGKEALLLEIVETGITKYLEAIAPIADGSEPADVRLREAIRAHIEVVADNIEQTLVTFHQWKYLEEANKQRVIAMRNSYQEMFIRIVKDGIKSGVFDKTHDATLSVLAILGMLNWVPEWFSPAGNRTAEDVADGLANIVLSGLMSPKPARAKRTAS
jgi:TetR/AcrR family transcriptional regulator, cholesterol catabolism regulator